MQTLWQIRPDTTYLNHGSFGPPPEPVRACQQTWRERLDRQPMDFFIRMLEPAIEQTKLTLADFVGTSPVNLALVDNATYGMNVVAHSFPLQSGDEVLLTDHEYGAVLRIWERACRRANIAAPKIAELPFPIEAAEQIVDTLFRQVTTRTRLLVVSHVASATAVILPVEKICAEARRRGIAVCVDGPHAVAQLPLDIDNLGCDFYTVSCHKWLSAPFGSGFLYVAPPWQPKIEPPILSWGRLPPASPAVWHHEFLWSGTRDYTAQLCIPTAIGVLDEFGIAAFRRQTHDLAAYAAERLFELTKLTSIVPRQSNLYGSMCLAALPTGDADALREALWQRFGIEIPVPQWRGRRWLRVSCHLYNTVADIDRLVSAISALM